jgi:UTP--glucose-1-phosphate uridylyltransferase
MKAVIPAAGMGTRFLPVTKAQPKEMLPIVDKPSLHYVVEEAIAADIKSILIITGRGKRAIVDYFDKNFELEHHFRDKANPDLEDIDRILNSADFFYVRQKEPLGLGHAILCAKHFVHDQAFAVLLGDDIILDECCTANIRELHEKTGSSIVAVEEVPKDRIQNYGVIDAKPLEDGTFLVNDLVEKPDPMKAPSNLALVGRYILTPDVFTCLEEIPRGRDDEYHLTDALRLLKDREDIYAYRVKGKRFDIGTKIGWMKASIEMAMHREEFGDELREFMAEVLDRES